MREERKKEIDSVVEQCRLAYTNDKPLLDEDGNYYDDEEGHDNQSPDEKLQQQQNRMQKELSTISERTENSPPGIINIESGRISRIGGTTNPKTILTMTAAAAAAANNTNSTTAMVSPLNTNTRETSATKPIRHLDMTNNTNTTTVTNRFNFLDSNNTLSGGDMPSSIKNNVIPNYSNNANKTRGTDDYKYKASDEKDRQIGADYDYSNNTATLVSASTIQTVKESPHFKYANSNSNNHKEYESDLSGDDSDDEEEDSVDDEDDDDEDESDANDYDEKNMMLNQKGDNDFDEYECQYKDNHKSTRPISYGDQRCNQIMSNNNNKLNASNNRNTNTKSFYSSQEDLLSSLNVSLV